VGINLNAKTADQHKADNSGLQFYQDFPVSLLTISIPMEHIK
jgi:hypothetical protein